MTTTQAAMGLFALALALVVVFWAERRLTSVNDNDRSRDVPSLESATSSHGLTAQEDDFHATSGEERLVLYRRLPTWIKQIALLALAIESLYAWWTQFSVRCLACHSPLLVALAALLLTHCDGIRLLPHRELRLAFLSVYLLLFLHALLGLFSNSPSPSLALLSFLSALVASFFACFNSFVVFSNTQHNEPSAEYLADLRRYLSFAYMNEIVFAPTLAKGSLDYEDVPGLSDADSARFIAQRIDAIKVRHKKYSLTRVLFTAVRDEWFAQGFFQFIGSSSNFIAPLALEKILIYIKYKGKDEYLSEGMLRVSIWTAVLLLFLGPCIASIGVGQNYVRGRHTGVRVKAALICQIYRKVLSVDLSSSEESIGKLNNLISVDVSGIQDFVAYSHYIWSTPFEIVVSTTMLFLVIGKSAVVGMLVMIFTMTIGTLMGKRLGAIQQTVLKRKDNRMSLMSEVLNSIRILKFNAWELDFIEKVRAARLLELSTLLFYSLMDALLKVVWKIAPVTVTVAAFLTYTEYFVYCATLLRHPLSNFPHIINLLVKSKISLDRIDSFLQTSDVPGLPALPPPQQGEEPFQKGFLALKEVTAAWRESHNSEKDKSKKEVSAKSCRERAVLCVSTLCGASSLRPAALKRNIKSGAKYALMKSSAEDIDDIELGVVNPIVQSRSSQDKMSSDVDDTDDGESDEDSNDERENERIRVVLRDLNLSVQPRSFVVIVGSTGSGKSSLLQGTLLGEGVIVNGQRIACGSLSYSPQSAWIQNASLKDNIIFGNDFDEKRYHRVLYSCCLLPDLKLLAAGDLTEIGEKGVNLSGGQQQRVNLARAAYNHSDIIILDDPLSAVDAHVGEHIFKNFILDFLKDRTTILVTHNLSLVLPFADQIVCLHGNNSAVVAQGTKSEVLAQLNRLSSFPTDPSNNVEFSFFRGIVDVLQSSRLQDRRSALESESADIIDDAGQRVGGVFGGAASNIVSIESKKSGEVSLSTYWYYLKACGGAIAAAALIIASLCISGSWLLQNYCLGQWMESMEQDKANVGVDLNRYIWSVIAVTGAYGTRMLVDSMCSFRAAQKMHDHLLFSVLLAPCSWFDATPIGRIVNRFSQDIATVDSALMGSLLDFVDCSLSTIQIVAVITWFIPSLLIALLPVVIFAVWIARKYLIVSRELKRLENIKKSPVFVLFSESLSGLAVIRAFRQENRFFETCCEHVDAMNKCHLYLWISNRWLNFRVELCGALVTVSVGAAIVYTTTHHPSAMSATAAGLSLMYSLTFCDSLNWTARTHANCQMDLNSVERLEEYSSLEPEKFNIHVPEANSSITHALLRHLCLSGCKPIERHQCGPILQDSQLHEPDTRSLISWPMKGEILFEDITLQYKSSLRPVLRNLSFRIEAGCKVGIVGRTGAGKSSLIAALFRIVEPSGKLIIDGVDALNIPLHELRRKIAIVPQEPTLFRGSLRFNLDPFDRHSDDEIWSALKGVQMADTLRAVSSSQAFTIDDNAELLSSSASSSSLLNKIHVSEKGGNFSVGQRQLLCMARAILRKSKILVLDECTASVDHETDTLIQEIVRHKLRDTTVICIAHRLHTVAYYDRILVMNEGKLAEYDSPYALLQREDSIFHAMCQSSGAFDDLFALAKESFHSVPQI